MMEEIQDLFSVKYKVKLLVPNNNLSLLNQITSKWRITIMHKLTIE